MIDHLRYLYLTIFGTFLFFGVELLREKPQHQGILLPDEPMPCIWHES